MNIIISVQLPRNRSKLGTLSVSSDAGVILIPETDCLGKSDSEFAKLNNNLARNPLKKGGDTPYGQYECTWERFQEPISESIKHSYGQYGLIHLNAIGGDALKACGPLDTATGLGGRTGIDLHGGELNPIYTSWGGLRPTHGCLRVIDSVILAMFARFEDLKPDKILCNVDIFIAS